MNERFAARIAEAYSRHSEKYASILEPMLRPMADEVVTLANLRGGELVLDLATGIGLIARTAAQFTAAVIGIDMSLGILGRARTLSAGQIPFVAGDAHGLPFKDACFDLVTCGISLSHFSEVAVALGEVLRVLRPGGRFITSAWGSEGESPAKEVAIEIRKKYLEDLELAYGGTFSEDVWADTEQGCQTLRQVGFAGVQVGTQYLSGVHRNAAVATEAALAWPVTRYRMARLDPATQRRLEEETAAAISQVTDLRWRSEMHYYQAVRPE
jgi:ubiquinone/menaquinone biosynthesis C-methylase UbiE